jgi:beta-glucanase (GH16 family)
VNDEDGFQGDENDIDEITDSSCSSMNVRRRRRAETMCSCRRRSSGKRYDGRWVCQNDKMVQEPPQYVNPIWSEEFEDERGDGTLNETRWILTHSGSGNGNNEKQFYTTRSENLLVEDGVLKIVGKPEDFDGKKYTSGKITTKNKGAWGPGVRVEVRAKLPLGVGTWPAIWMMPTDSRYGGWPDSGEIDIMEAIGKSHGKVFGTIHTGAYNHMKGTHKGKSFYTDFSEWHTYALDWKEDKLEWYADGNLYNTFAPDNTDDYSKWPFNRRFYLILNLALGGNLGGRIGFENDQVMEIDYVRIFCLDGTTNCAHEQVTCCEACQAGQYCSHISGNCYAEQKKWYYESCEA